MAMKCFYACRLQKISSFYYLIEDITQIGLQENNFYGNSKTRGFNNYLKVFKVGWHMLAVTVSNFLNIKI